MERQLWDTTNYAPTTNIKALSSRIHRASGTALSCVESRYTHEPGCRAPVRFNPVRSTAIIFDGYLISRAALRLSP